MALRRKYVPDLQHLHAECEANYARLRCLLGDAGEGDRIRIGLHVEGSPISIELAVEVEAPFTTTLRISQHPDLGEFCLAPQMRVMLYHDARMAEVVSYQNQGNFQGAYSYPNPRMRQPDEKVALNGFLTEWLSVCLQRGAVTGMPMPAS